MAIETLTINNLRAKTGNTSDIYYTTDIGQEGEWYYDAADSTSIDNLGTILVSTNGLRFKRIYDAGIVNVTWFGAKGDGNTDDHSAIQNALNFISDTSNYTSQDSSMHIPGDGVVLFPKGIFNISNTLLVGYNCKISGVSNKAINNYAFADPVRQDTGGTIIKCAFEDANNWAISSASRFGIHGTILPPPDDWVGPFLPPIFSPLPPSGELLGYDKWITAKGSTNLTTNSYNNYTWNQGILTLQDKNIYVNFCYFLFQVNNQNNISALLDVKFVNISINTTSDSSVALSSIFGTPILGVDYIQINSVLPALNYTLPDKGWNNATIIRNNF